MWVRIQALPEWACCFWARHFNSLCLCFSICKIWMEVLRKNKALFRFRHAAFSCLIRHADLWGLPKLRWARSLKSRRLSSNSSIFPVCFFYYYFLSCHSFSRKKLICLSCGREKYFIYYLCGISADDVYLTPITQQKKQDWHQCLL